MKWFENVFLLSLEERFSKIKGNLWLTKKQTDICKRYMDFSSTVKGAMDYTIGNKQYHIQIAPNGCAAFSVLVDGWIQK